MQAPKGPRGRGRSRGAIRAAASSKGNSDDENHKRAGRKVRFNGSSGSAPFAAAAPSYQPKNQAGQPSFRNKQIRNNHTPNNTHGPNGVSNGAPATASTPLTNQAWRDPTIEGHLTYNKRMSELYQTVCFPLPYLLTGEACSDIFAFVRIVAQKEPREGKEGCHQRWLLGRSEQTNTTG